MIMCLSACLTVVNGRDLLQWIWHLPWHEDTQLAVNEAISLAWHVEHTVLQVRLIMMLIIAIV